MPDINRSFTWAVNTCNAPRVGYSQTYRNQRTVNGITYYDCSSFIWYALIAGGFPLSTSAWPFTTYTMAAILTQLGFTQLPVTGVWKPGDVLLRSTHTEMVYTGGTGSGVTMGAHTSNRPLADQVSINTYTSYASSWASLWRYGNGATGDTGYSDYVIAALCGNAWQESGINPGRSEVGGTGYGIWQWSSSRRTALETWLTANGYALDDGFGQCAYLLYEDFWSTGGTYSTLTDFLESTSTSIADLTEQFMLYWEIAGVQQLQHRITYAQNCYEYIQLHAQDSSITNWITSSGSLAAEERYNNAVMLYRFFSTGGGGGTPGKTKHDMPVWMKIRYHY